MKTGNRRQAIGNSKKAEIVLYVLCALLVALTLPVEAQQHGKIYRIGYLDPAASNNTDLLATFRQKLGKLGWNEGKNSRSST